MGLESLKTTTWQKINSTVWVVNPNASRTRQEEPVRWIGRDNLKLGNGDRPHSLIKLIALDTNNQKVGKNILSMKYTLE